MWRVILLAIASIAAACNAQAFACGGDGECALAGEAGVCLGGNCAYPDPDCPSGFRYPQGLGNGLAGACVPVDEIDATGAEAATGDDPPVTSSSTAPASSEEGPASTSSSTTEPIDPTTTDGSSSSSSTGKSESTSTGADSSSTAMVLECTDFECADCMRCVDDDGEVCEDVFATCNASAGCVEAAGCMEFCVAYGSCATNCCEGLTVAAALDALDLHMCRLEACPMLCMDVEPMCA